MKMNFLKYFGLAALIGLAMPMASFGATLISSASQLKSYLESTGTATLQLTTDLTVNQAFTVKGTKTLNLNGHTITSNGYPTSGDGVQPAPEWSGLFVLRSGANFTLDGTGTIRSNVSGGYAIRTADNTGLTVTIGKGVSIYAPRAVYVQARPEDEWTAPISSKGTTINVYGKLVGDSSDCIDILLTNDGGIKNLNINVYPGADLMVNNRNKGSVAETIVNVASGTTGSLNITGGVFHNHQYYDAHFAISAGSGFAVNVTGGYFGGNDSISAAEGYEFVGDETQYACLYKVMPKSTWQIERSGEKYQTYAAAINAAQDGDTIVLLADVDDQIGEMSGKSLTVDLNGHTVTHPKRAVNVANGGNLTVKGGTVKGDELPLFVINGNLTIEDVTATAGATYCVYIDTNYSTGLYYPASLAVKGDSVLTTTMAGKATISLFGSNSGSTQYPASLNVESGIIKNDGGSVAISASNYQPTAVKITGGEFGPITTYGNGTWDITGGTFASNPSAYIPEGYEAVDNGNGTWTVKKTSVEIKVEVAEEVTVTTDGGEEVPAEVAEKAAEVVEKTKEAVAGNNAAAEVAETGVAKVIFVQGEVGEEAKIAKDGIAAELKAAVETDEKLTPAEKEKALEKIANSEIDGYVEVKLEGTAVSVIEPTTEVAARVELKTIIYEVKPVMAVTVVTKDESGAVLGSNTVERVITNEELAKEAAILTFRLPLTDDFTKNALVRHEGDLDRIVKVQGGLGGRYVELAATHFSPFIVEKTDEEVPIVLDGGDVLGIVRYEGDAAKRERIVSVPWLSRGEDGELDEITVADIVTVNGLADGDMLHVWNGEKNAYDVFRWDGSVWKGAKDLKTGYTPDPTRKLKRGTAFWYERTQPAGDFTLMGLVSNGCSTAIEPGTKPAPRMSLLTNPFPRDFDIVGKIVIKTLDSKTKGPAKGDQIVLIDSNFRYEYNGTAWGVRVPGGVDGRGITQPDKFNILESIIIKAGEAFWYISKSGDPVIEW